MENTPNTTATTSNAAGIAVTPVTAYAVVITPAATVNGAIPDITKPTTARTPKLSRAKAASTRLGGDGAVLVTLIHFSQLLKRGFQERSVRSCPVGHHRRADRSTGLRDQQPQRIRQRR